MLKYYSKLFEPLPDEDDEDEPSTSGQMVQQEYHCLDIVGDTELKGVPKQKSNVIRGTYVPNLLAIQIAQWVSFDFGHKVSSIVVDHYKYTMTKKDDTISKQQTTIEDLKKLIEDNDRKNEQRFMDADKKSQERLEDIERRSQERHDELRGIINSAIKYLKTEEDKGNREILLIYRLKKETKDTLHIHAGKRTSFKIPKAEKCDYLFIGDHISNSKRVVRYLKDNRILPSNGTSSTYKITSDCKREKLYSIVNGINDEYKKVSDNTK